MLCCVVMQSVLCGGTVCCAALCFVVLYCVVLGSMLCGGCSVHEYKQCDYHEISYN